ncbi:2-isopropylmalate synthase [Phytohabitans sp. LJ34]|uniref:2-isopropylmalate synthase n=1 Tax=Phytohabitans sp. LJ34 TaxID=3452217 RepID=UPI003F8B8815
MPVHRYTREERRPGGAADRAWPGRTIDHPPLWCSVDLRDGNQALPDPMSPARKGAMFDLLVRMGFKAIEVGYPSASDADFTFVRRLVTEDRVPDDVTIAVFTPARLDLIERTFAAIEGADRAMVHLCMATACLWREVVFRMSAAQLREVTTGAAAHVARLADRMTGSRLCFEYSPETFNVTEPEFALEMANAVAATWDAAPDRPVTVNLPSTVETDSPNVFADQIEWMHRNLDRRDSIVLSVHPHNDRGTAVASAELALLAGADRVEGTLFGNGERTGNVCLATLALNMFSHGVDPQLDFSDIDDIRRTVEQCNRMPVGQRHPYVGDLVYTAFSGTHQDAIAKGFRALEDRARAEERPPGALPWSVPYLPIDPRDVGRTYESVVRVNSQSGKGGVAHVLRTRYGLDVPVGLRAEFAKVVQRAADESGMELDSRQLWDTFRNEYLHPHPSLLLKEFQEWRDGDLVRLDALVAFADGREARVAGAGADVVAAFADGLGREGQPVEVRAVTEQSVADPAGPYTAVYAEASVDGAAAYGVGLDPAPARAALNAVLSAVNRIMA